MGNENSTSMEALGSVSCSQALFQCDSIGTSNVPAYAFSAPKTQGGMSSILGARKGKKSDPEPSKDPPSSAADAVAAGNCLQYCIPVQNSLAIKGTLHAKLGYCCAQGFNNFQGSVHELVPGMNDIAIWQYEEGESPF